MSAKITIIWAVPAGYQPGDYARLYGNGGGGDINYDVPLTNERFELFQDGGGLYGWGHTPWGHTPWGKAWATKVPGWGHLPWGHSPWGHGTTLIKVEYLVEQCGEYKFAFKIFDKLGNENTGSPQEVTAEVHIAPPPPTGLKKVSYNKTSQVLVLEAA
jgi:hypothetical protein